MERKNMLSMEDKGIIGGFIKWGIREPISMVLKLVKRVPGIGDVIWRET